MGVGGGGEGGGGTMAAVGVNRKVGKWGKMGSEVKQK